MTIDTPKEFSFTHCLSFLQRSPVELLHQLQGRRVVKALRLQDEVVIFSVSEEPGALSINFLTREPAKHIKQGVVDYIKEWFDVDTDLRPFYEIGTNDELLKDLVTRYYGYRIVGHPDLFESLVWAVLGQQINLAFAYTLKRRFVEKYGERLVLAGSEYFLFPSPETVALVKPEELLELQFSRQKSSYTVEIAEAFVNGTLSKEKLSAMPIEEARHQLISIKGVGNWTANYALMKTFRHPDAFPLEDAGLHNAIRKLTGLGRKPTLSEVKKIFKKYKGWEAYATLYLWKSLS